MYKEFTIENGDTRLYCRSFGDGAPLLMIHGACVDGDFFQETAQYLSLSQRYTIYTYDRRGYGRSSMPGDGDHSISTQVEDARALIKRIGEPCLLVAHSIGAVIAFELAKKHPGLIRQMFLYEPAVVGCLPPEDTLVKERAQASAWVKAGKINRAANYFLLGLGTQDKRARLTTQAEEAHLGQNIMTFVQKEMEETSTYCPEFSRVKNIPIVIGVGDGSPQDGFGHIASRLAQQLSAPLLYLPGIHNCPYDLPQEFACMAIGIFSLCHEIGAAGLSLF